MSQQLISSQTLKLTAPVPLTLHPAAVYLESLSAGSVPTMKQALDAIASRLTSGDCDCLSLNWAALRYQHTSAIRAALKKQYAPATANKMLCALRRVLKEALRLDLIDPIDYAKAVDLASIPQTRQLRGRALSCEEISNLIAVCDQSEHPLDLRDAALIAILRGAGLRRAEVIKLQLKDFNCQTGALAIQLTFPAKS